MLINNILIPVLKKIKDWSKKKGYDKYVKNHFLDKMFIFLLYQHSSNEEYGRTLSMRLKALCGQEFSVPSQGELSKKLSHKLPLKVWIDTYRSLLGEVSRIKNKKLRKLAKKLKIIDSSTFQASLSMTWAEHRTTANGFKIHMKINSDLVPEEFRLKNGKSSDKKSLKWAIKPGFIYVFDRGYNDYQQFQWIVEHDAFFVTRTLRNIKYCLIKQNQVTDKQKTNGIISDDLIELTVDKVKNITGRFRLIKFKFTDTNGKVRVFSFITNVFDLSSEEIAEIYKDRWQIETFFKWIKMCLELAHWISRSKVGVKIQLYSALILYMMVKLASIMTGSVRKVMKDFCHEFNAIFLRIMEYYQNQYDSLFYLENLC